MIPKNKAPHLNRAQRRHPARLLQPATLPAGSGMPWLLYGLLMRGGYLAGNPLPASQSGLINEKPAARPLGKSIFNKAVGFFRRMIGR